MVKFAKCLGFASSLALAFGVAACNKTPAEKQVDAQAEAIDKSYQADALRDKGEAVKDHLKKEADELHDDTKNMPSKADQNPK
jgi:hypothetical protein